MYKIVAKKLHPDRFANREQTPEVKEKIESFKQVSTAYNKRNSYGVRSRYLKRNYGITLEDYDKLSEQQNHCCAICHSPEAGGKFNKRFMIDKDKRGEIRGLICKSCKVVLVEVGDNIHTLKSMIEYLHKEKKQ